MNVVPCGDDQAFARFLIRGYTSDQDAWSDEDVEIFVARLREQGRARAASALYRRFIIPEAVRILAGRYRNTRLRTPTRVLYGAEDPGIRTELLGGYEDYADDLALEFVDGASHFVADERPDVVVVRALELFAPSPARPPDRQSLT
ncbi:MAG: alpha/beta fold hydrolase [Nocardioidaceae bacterium]